MTEQPKRLGSLLRRLNSSTILAHYRVTQEIPRDIINFFRGLVDDSHESPTLKNISNPYEFAKKRLNLLWQEDDAKTSSDNPVNDLTSIRKLTATYWTQEKWQQSAKQAGLLTSMAVINGVLPAIMVQQGAETMNALRVSQEAFLWELKDTLAVVYGWFGMQQLGMRIRDKTARDMTLFLREKFADALEKNPKIFEKLNQKQGVLKSENKEESASLDEAMYEAPKKFTDSFVNRTTQAINTTTSLTAAGVLLYSNAVPIEFLEDFAQQLRATCPEGICDFINEKGTFLTSIALASVYGAASWKKGKQLGEKTEQAQETRDNTASRTREGIVKNLNTFNQETSQNHKSYKERLKADYELAGKADKEYFKQSTFNGLTFETGYLVSLIPAFLGKGIEQFWNTQLSTFLFLNKISEAIRLASERGEMTVPRTQMIALAKEIEKEWGKKLQEDIEEFVSDPDMYEELNIEDAGQKNALHPNSTDDLEEKPTIN